MVKNSRLLDLFLIYYPHKSVIELNKDNILNYLRIHEKDKDILNHFYQRKFEYISSHIHELCENHDEEFISITNIDTY